MIRSKKNRGLSDAWHIGQHYVGHTAGLTDLKSVLLFSVTVIPSLIPVVHHLSASEHVSCSYDCVEKEYYSCSAIQNFPALKRIPYPYGQVHLSRFLLSICGVLFLFFPHGSAAPIRPGPPHYRGFAITLRHTTLGRIPLDELAARRRDST